MVLVTGGTGLLGSHVLFELIKAGKRVRALKSSHSNILLTARTIGFYSSEAIKLFNTIEWVEGNLADIYTLLEAMEGVDEVYHCAALVSFNPKDEHLITKVNVEGTANMVNAALEKGIKKFCHVSSVAAIGVSDELITEETYWKSSPGNSSYSISKYGAEREVWRGIEEGLNAVIVNPGIIIGPGNWQSSTSSPNLFNKAHKGLPFYTEGVTCFVDVRDVAKIMLNLMESSITGQRFIVSSENLPFKQFFDQASVLFARPKPSLKAGVFLSEIAWRAERIVSLLKGRNPLITKETARSAHQKRYYSNTKIKKALNYSFMPMEKSIADTCSLFLIEENSKVKS